MDGWMDGWTDGRTDGRTDLQKAGPEGGGSAACVCVCIALNALQLGCSSTTIYNEHGSEGIALQGKDYFL